MRGDYVPLGRILSCCIVALHLLYLTVLIGFKAVTAMKLKIHTIDVIWQDEGEKTDKKILEQKVCAFPE
jgi:hypothetical protein